jgi:PAS domain S-box-containing protein
LSAAQDNDDASEHLRFLVEQIPAIVWTADEAYRFTSVYGAGVELLGVARGTFEPVAMSDALGSGEPTSAALAAQRRALSGESAQYTTVWEGRIYDCKVEPRRCGGRLVGTIGIALDVTERRQAEREALSASDEAIRCMVRAIERRDMVTGSHIMRMSDFCLLLAEELRFDPLEQQQIALASRLHDIGKIAVPDGILLKAGRLTHEERKVMERHCVVGHDILAVSDSSTLKLAATIALTHHERFDGYGYPQGLAGQEIPQAGRIAAIADAFDALTSDRPYRAALDPDDARSIMLEERATHFDPALLDVFFASPMMQRLFTSAATPAAPGRRSAVIRTLPRPES